MPELPHRPCRAAGSRARAICPLPGLALAKAISIPAAVVPADLRRAISVLPAGKTGSD